MKLNKLIIVSIILLTLISIGAATAVSDDITDNSSVGTTEDLKISSSDVDEITVDSDDAVSDDVNDDSKLSASAEDEKLSAGTVSPKYTINITPDIMQSTNYVAQYGQIINVKGDYGNATGNVSIKFGFSGNYYEHNDIPLVDGKFSYNLTDYDRVRNNYEIQIKYSGDNYYKSVSTTKKIHIQMQNITTGSAEYGLNPYIDVNLFDATGNVTFTLNGRNYTKKLEKGKTTQEFTNYTLGKNTVTMYYEGDGVIKPIEKDFTFTVDVNVRAPTIYNFQPAFVEASFGQATGKVNFTFNNKTQEVDIIDGVASTELKGYVIGENAFEISYSGDATFNPFKTTKTLTVLDKENATIISSVYQTASQNFIFIKVPYANGNINVTVNGKKEVWTLLNETVIKEINPTDKINELKVSFDGNVRLNPSYSSFYVNLTDYIVNEKTFRHYFDISNGGRLYDFLEDGITLDFQGKVFINTNSENEIDIIISKPINIISSTNDAYIDLNTTAGSLSGEHPGSSFVVGREGSGSNISGIYLHNTELWISNTTNVVFNNISVVVEDQRVGSGVGATSVRDNSSYVTIKNSYFYTRNNGGSTTFTFAWATHCVFDNNTVKVEGNVGNLLYLNVYNIKNLPGPTKVSWGDILPDYPLNNYNSFINNRLYGKEGSLISVGIMVEGTYNLIANNTLNKTSISTSSGGTGAANNTYYGNVLMQGSSLTAQPYSIIYNNTVPGALSTGANSVAYNNTVGGKITVGAGASSYNNILKDVTVSGAGANVFDNNITGAVTVSGAGANVYGNELNGTTKITGKNVVFGENEINGNVSIANTNVTLSKNDISGTVIFTSAATECNIVGNSIESKSEYAIDLGTSKNNFIRDNVLLSSVYAGLDAVNNNDESNVLEGVNVNLTVSVEDMLAGQNSTVVNISINESANGYVTVIVNGKGTNLRFDSGKTSLTLNRDDFVDGEYSVVVVYNGDDTFGPDYAIDSFKVYYYEGELNITVSNAKEGEDVVINATLLGINQPTVNLQLIIDGETYNVPFINGSNVATYTINNVSAGEHTVIAFYPGETGIYSAECLKTFSVEQSEPVKVLSTSFDCIPFTNFAVDTVAGEKGALFTVVLKNEAGEAVSNESVTVVLDNIVYSLKTDANGVASMQVNLANAGTYTATISFLGNAYNNATFATAKLVVNKKDTAIVAKNAKFKAKAKTKKYSATLKTTTSSVDGKTYLSAGKKVTLKVKGKTYAAKTNANGKVTFKIKKLTKKGKYSAVIKFAGDETYNAATKKVKITLK